MHLQNHTLYVSDGKTESSSIFQLRKAEAALTTDQMTTRNIMKIVFQSDEPTQLCSSLPSAPKSFVVSFSSLFQFMANSFTVLFQSHAHKPQFQQQQAAVFTEKAVGLHYLSGTK